MDELQSLARDLHKKLLILKDEKKQIKEIYNFLYAAYIFGNNFVSKKDYKRIDEKYPIKKL